MMDLEKKIRLVLAEDEEVIRAGIARKIAALDGSFEIAALAGNGREALEAVRRLQPDAVLTDIKMPEMDGLSLIEEMSRCFPEVKVVILSGYDDFSYMQQAIRFGVCNYLKKPVEQEALQEMLQALKATVLADRRRHHRTVIFSPRSSAPEPEKTLRYGLFVVRVGNISYDIRDDSLNELYVEQQSRISWYLLLDGLCPEAEDWSVTEEEEKNRRLLCFSLPEGVNPDQRAIALELQRRLLELFPEMPVTVATTLRPVEQDDVWLCAQRLRNILRQKSVLARSCCFTLEEDESMEGDEILHVLKMRVNAQLRTAIARKDESRIRENLMLVFRFMEQRALSQAVWQRVAQYILGIMEFSGSLVRENLQTQLLRTMSTLSTDQDPAEVLTQLLLRIFKGKDEQPEELAERLKQYLDRCYLTIENMEEVADAFSYSYPHLSRLFTKTYGQSMSRYVQQKRMELAKQVIENNSELSISEIARICGFEDSRYFSRMFKAYEGQTPSEYRSAFLPEQG